MREPGGVSLKSGVRAELLDQIGQSVDDVVVGVFCAKDASRAIAPGWPLAAGS